jgi:hypothetical protein
MAHSFLRSFNSWSISSEASYRFKGRLVRNWRLSGRRRAYLSGGSERTIDIAGEKRSVDLHQGGYLAVYLQHADGLGVSSALEGRCSSGDFRHIGGVV